MSGLFGTTASLEVDLTLLLEVVILIMLLIGLKSAKEKTPKGLKRHGRILTVAVVLNAFAVVFIMWPTFSPYISQNGFQAETSLTGFPLTFIHHLCGLVAQILGTVFIFKKFGKVRLWMRVTAILWLVALLSGIFFYIRYYVIG